MAAHPVADGAVPPCTASGTGCERDAQHFRYIRERHQLVTGLESGALRPRRPPIRSPRSSRRPAVLGRAGASNRVVAFRQSPPPERRRRRRPHRPTPISTAIPGSAETDSGNDSRDLVQRTIHSPKCRSAYLQFDSVAIGVRALDQVDYGLVGIGCLMQRNAVGDSVRLDEERRI